MLIAPPGRARRSRLSGLPALLATFTHHEIDVVVVWSVSRLGTPVDTLLDTLAELHWHGVRLVIHGHADDGTTVEAGGLLAAAAQMLYPTTHDDSSG